MLNCPMIVFRHCLGPIISLGFSTVSVLKSVKFNGKEALKVYVWDKRHENTRGNTKRTDYLRYLIFFGKEYWSTLFPKIG